MIFKEEGEGEGVDVIILFFLFVSFESGVGVERWMRVEGSLAQASVRLGGIKWNGKGGMEKKKNAAVCFCWGQKI